MARIHLITAAIIVFVAACGGGDHAGEDTPDGGESPLQAWAVPADGSMATPPVFAEVSDLLPRVQRQNGRHGEPHSFLPEPERGLIAKARITDVEPWYSVMGTTSGDSEVRNDGGDRVIKDYGVDGSLWSMTKVSFEIVDDYGEPDFEFETLTIEARGTVEDFEKYIGTDLIILAGKGLPYTASNGSRGLEWFLSSISPIADDGTIAWPGSLPVGRSTTIDAFELIARTGEIVVTEDGSNPPVVVERRTRS